jgi:hypothetical protein
MRYLMYPAAAAAMATVFLALPAEAAHDRYHSRPHPFTGSNSYAGESSGSKGYGTGPHFQGEPTDNLPIWRNGYYQGNDPDQFIRLQLMRDPTNGPKSR